MTEDEKLNQMSQEEGVDMLATWNTPEKKEDHPIEFDHSKGGVIYHIPTDEESSPRVPQLAVVPGVQYEIIS